MTHGVSRRAVVAGSLAAAGLSATGRRSRAQSGPIRIGITQSISGPLAFVGTQHVTGARIATKMINDSGGIDGRPVELVVRDTRNSASDMVAALRELAGDGINLFVGEAFSTGDLAAWPIAPSLNIVVAAPSVVAMELNHDLYNRNCFHAGQNAYMQYVGQARVIAQRYKDVKRWGAIVADAAGFRASHAYFTYGLKKTYAEFGIQADLVDPVIVKIGAGEYRTQCSELMSQKLDGLLLGFTGGELITFIKQARSFRLLNDLRAMADLTYNPMLGPTLKSDMPNNYFSSCTWVYDAFKDVPMAQTFYKLAVEEGKNSIPDPFFAQVQIAVATLAEGVRRAKTTDTDAVIKAIETMTFDTVFGPMSYRPEDHQLRFSPGYVRLAPDGGPDGWKIAEFIRLPWQEAIEPASPGKKFELG